MQAWHAAENHTKGKSKGKSATAAVARELSACPSPSKAMQASLTLTEPERRRVGRLEPDEREIPELSPEDWEQVMKYRGLVYETVGKFVSKVAGRDVRMEGAIGTPEFRWYVGSGGQRDAYGVDVATICQDLEYRALEAAAVAFHRYDPVKGHGKKPSKSYLTKAILRELQHEFNRIRTGELTEDVDSYDELMLIDGEQRRQPEPSYLDPHDQDEPGDGLRDEDREALQIALGALTSREAWALRMVADGTPTAVIAENLGLKTEGGARNFINEAKRKAQAAYTEAQG